MLYIVPVVNTPWKPSYLAAKSHSKVGGLPALMLESVTVQKSLVNSLEEQMLDRTY